MPISPEGSVGCPTVASQLAVHAFPNLDAEGCDVRGVTRPHQKISPSPERSGRRGSDASPERDSVRLGAFSHVVFDGTLGHGAVDDFRQAKELLVQVDV